MIDIKDLLSMIPATPGDTAAGFMGYAAGFGADVLLFPLGVPPGTTAAVTALGSVGAKRTYEAISSVGKVKREIRKKATSVIERLERQPSKVSQDELANFKEDYSLWKDDLCDDEFMINRINEVIHNIRTTRMEGNSATNSIESVGS